MTLKVSAKTGLRDFRLDASLEVGDREVLAIIGENGCGKTTMLNIIAGLMTPEDGHVSLDDSVLFDSASRVNVPPEHRNIGYLFQSYALFPYMTVYDNVSFGLRMRHMASSEISSRVKPLLENMGMWELRREKAARLSGGQKQRVALCRALAINPAAFLLDEPLSALDAEAQVALRHDLKLFIKNLGVPAVIVTHSVKEAREIADRVCVLEKGKVVAMGTLEGVLREGTSRFVDAIIKIE